LSEQTIDAQGDSPHSLSATKILRLASLILVGLSFVVIHLYDVGQVGNSMQWKDGNATISAGSYPAMLLWAAVAVAFFILLNGQETKCGGRRHPHAQTQSFCFHR
jgi:hypothetical protein